MENIGHKTEIEDDEMTKEFETWFSNLMVSLHRNNIGNADNCKINILKPVFYSCFLSGIRYGIKYSVAEYRKAISQANTL